MILSSMFLCSGAMAEIIKRDSTTPPDKWDGVNSTLDRKNPEKLKVMYKDQFRCWQHGNLIVDESYWKLSESKIKSLLTKEGKDIFVFEYGETFCMYRRG